MNQKIIYRWERVFDTRFRLGGGDGGGDARGRGSPWALQNVCAFG